MITAEPPAQTRRKLPRLSHAGASLTDGGTTADIESLLLLFVSVQDVCALVCVVRFHVDVRPRAALCSALSLRLLFGLVASLWLRPASLWLHPASLWSTL